MAPHSSAIAQTMNQSHIVPRGLGSNSTATHGTFTHSQGNTLQLLALVFSSFSVASSILSFYWFMKMRRSFRHDLIMLLIQSDMFKALWFMLYPVVVFTTGPVASESTFCQVNGFFLALGIEASDFAVLQIAFHTALYIFRPRVSSGEGGLYPYRNFAYICWVIFPVLMASLAFINEGGAYVSEGTYCYLPVRPFWYRLALSWIPRYIIFIIIFCIYVSIYYYVRYKFHGFKKAGRSRGDENSNSLNSQHPPIQYNLPPTPTLACHGLIPESQQQTAAEDAPKPSLSTLESYRDKRSPAKSGVHRFMWANIMASNKRVQSPSPPPESSLSDIDSFVGPSTPHPLPNNAAATPMSPRSPESSITPSRSRLTSWRDTFVHRFSPHNTNSNNEDPSVLDVFGILRHPDGSDSPPISRIELVNSRGQNMADAEMVRTRDKIRRQLRFLFIYPLVYMGMWVVPFVSHVLQYDDKFATHSPFALSAISTVFICSQAAVDCWLFSTREKPWKHIPGSDGTFWGSLKFWTGWKGVSKRRVVRGPGKTRDEMLREARAAHRRREMEVSQLEAGHGSRPESVARRDREWWEHSGNPAMSRVAEEISNPVENLVIQDDSGSDAEATLTNIKTRSSQNTTGAQQHLTFMDHDMKKGEE